MPYANFTDLEFDRQLTRVDDLFTVELLTSFIMWKLRENGQSRYDPPVPSPIHSHGTPTEIAHYPAHTGK
jgi:hypothetical protein